MLVFGEHNCIKSANWPKLYLVYLRPCVRCSEDSAFGSYIPIVHVRTVNNAFKIGKRRRNIRCCTVFCGVKEILSRGTIDNPSCLKLFTSIVSTQVIKWEKHNKVHILLNLLHAIYPSFVDLFIIMFSPCVFVCVCLSMFVTMFVRTI